MTENKLTFAEKLSIPGKLVGEYVNYHGEKWQVYGDFRIPKFSEELQICRGTSRTYTHIKYISEWIEPVPPKKKLVAPFLYGSNPEKMVFLSDLCYTKEEAERQGGFIKWCESLAIEIPEG